MRAYDDTSPFQAVNGALDSTGAPDEYSRYLRGMSLAQQANHEQRARSCRRTKETNRSVSGHDE